MPLEWLTGILHGKVDQLSNCMRVDVIVRLSEGSRCSDAISQRTFAAKLPDGREMPVESVTDVAFEVSGFGTLERQSFQFQTAI